MIHNYALLMKCHEIQDEQVGERTSFSFIQDTLNVHFCTPTTRTISEQQQYYRQHNEQNEQNDHNQQIELVDTVPTFTTPCSSDTIHHKKKIISTATTARNSTNRAKSRKTRVYTFYDFLIKTYYPFLLDEVVDNNNNNNNNNNNKIVILDVAGGKGHLSWLFSNLHHHIQSIVIDPRNDFVDIDNIQKNYKSILKSISFLENNPHIVHQRNIIGTKEYQPLAALLPQLIQRRNERRSNSVGSRHNNKDDLEEHDDNNDEHSNGAEEEWVYPKRMKIYFDDTLVRTMTRFKNIKNSIISSELQEYHLKNRHRSNDNNAKECTTIWLNYWHKANGTISTTTATGIKEVNNQEYPNHNNNTDDNGVIQCPNEALECISNTKLIVGFHPDQATEAIVDLALELSIPFCIVPCCVFPKEFPNRFIYATKTEATTKINGDSDRNHGGVAYHDQDEQDQHRVRDYDSFLTYLKFKDERIREMELPFQFTDTARRVVLYMLPEDFQ